MRILSIETSCDDTGITIMEVTGGMNKASFKVLADSANSQIAIHVPYGGVFPMLAKREHIKNLPILLEKVLDEAALSHEIIPLLRSGSVLRDEVENASTSPALAGTPQEENKFIDAIAVTYGPGLEPSLWTGITFAEELAKKWKVPIIPTNHMEGHIFSVFAKEKKFKVEKVKTPALSLLVSGGHTQLIVSPKWMEYEIIGETLDDAVGEAFDKVARMMGLPYPGGPEISKLAEELRSENENKVFPGRNFSAEKLAQSSDRHPAESHQNLFSFSLPRPMLYTKDFNFSYSGLKTAVLYLIRDLAKKDPNILQNDKIKQAIALEFENAAVECLIYKTKKAIEKYKIKTLMLGGGVACNEHLRSELKKLTKLMKVKLLIPEKKFTGDNSLMIGIAGYLQYMKNKKKVPKPSSIKATGNLKL